MKIVLNKRILIALIVTAFLTASATESFAQGELLERKASYDDGAMGLKYTYIDKHGDGLWDYFLDYSKHKYYIRNNLCRILTEQR